jgi:hypothetical protein
MALWEQGRGYEEARDNAYSGEEDMTYYVHKRYALRCQIGLLGIELNSPRA